MKLARILASALFAIAAMSTASFSWSVLFGQNAKIRSRHRVRYASPNSGSSQWSEGSAATRSAKRESLETSARKVRSDRQRSGADQKPNTLAISPFCLTPTTLRFLA